MPQQEKRGQTHLLRLLTSNSSIEVAPPWGLPWNQASRCIAVHKNLGTNPFTRTYQQAGAVCAIREVAATQMPRASKVVGFGG